MVAISPEAAQFDQGNAVIAVTYVFIIVTILFVALRVSLALVRRRRFGIDDALLISAAILGFLAAICTGTAVLNGLGRSIVAVHSGQLLRYFKLSYASQIFGVLATTASELSVVALIQRLTSYKSPLHRYIRFLYPVIISWMVFAAFGLAFQCDVPDPWIYAPSRCAGQGAIWYPIVVFGILIDIVLAFGFLPMVKDVQIDASSKNKVTILFLSRLIVPVFSIAYIAVLTPALSSVDQTRAMTNPSVLAQLAMDLSIATAAIPALSRVVIHLEPVSTGAVVSEISAVNLESSHARSVSDENKKLRDWAFAQLRSTPTPNSLIKDISMDFNESPRKPDQAHLGLERADTAPPVPARSEKRASPHLSLNFSHLSAHLDVREAWFVDSKRTSANTDHTIDVIKRPLSHL